MLFATWLGALGAGAGGRGAMLGVGVSGTTGGFVGAGVLSVFCNSSKDPIVFGGTDGVCDAGGVGIMGCLTTGMPLAIPCP